jgi:hypothetical protein
MVRITGRAAPTALVGKWSCESWPRFARVRFVLRWNRAGGLKTAATKDRGGWLLAALRAGFVGGAGGLGKAAAEPPHSKSSRDWGVGAEQGSRGCDVVRRGAKGNAEPRCVGVGASRCASGRGLAEVFGDFAGGVVAAGAGYAVAWVGAVAAEVEMLYGGGVAGPA